MPIGLPKWENIITAATTEKNDVIFSKRQDFYSIRSRPLKSSYWVWGSAVSSPSGVQGPLDPRLSEVRLTCVFVLLDDKSELVGQLQDLSEE